MGTEQRTKGTFPHMVFADLSFVYLSIVILAIITCHKEWSNEENGPPDLAYHDGDGGGMHCSILKCVFSNFEIAFASVVLFGFAATKCVSIAGKSTGTDWKSAAGCAAYIITCGLVPSMTFLVLDLLDEHKMRPWLTITQTSWLIIASIVFVKAGMVAERLEAPETPRTRVEQHHTVSTVVTSDGRQAIADLARNHFYGGAALTKATNKGIVPVTFDKPLSDFKHSHQHAHV